MDNLLGPIVPPTLILQTGDQKSQMVGIMKNVLQLTCTEMENFIGTIGHVLDGASLFVRRGY